MVANLDRQLKKDDPNYIFNTGPVQSYLDFTYGSVTSYRAIDDSTVEMKLKAPSAALLASLAMVWNGVVSPTAAAKYGKEFRNHPVGSGPFTFREWRERDQVVLDANPDYWKGKPKVDHLVFKEYPDPQAALLALKRGEVQIMGDVATPVIAAIRADPHLEVLTQPGLAVNGMAMPNDVPPFNDKRVRQALNYAVDKAAIDKALYSGLATPMVSPLPEAQWGFDKTLKGYPYDPAKAKALLAAAGVKPGLKVELLAYNTPRGYNPAGPDLAVALQGYFQKVGIEADVRKLDMGAFLATVRSGKYQGMFISGFSGDNGDPDNFLNALFNSSQMPVGDTSHYKNEAVDKEMDAAAREPDHEKRVAMYQDDPAADPGRCAVGVRELGAAGARHTERGEGVPAEPDADVLRHGSGVGAEVTVIARSRATKQSPSLVPTDDGDCFVSPLLALTMTWGLTAPSTADRTDPAARPPTG